MTDETMREALGAVFHAVARIASPQEEEEHHQRTNYGDGCLDRLRLL